MLTQIDALLNLFTLNRLDAIMILICAGLFFVMWRNLDRLFFKPYESLLDLRDKAIYGDRSEADQLLETTRQLNKSLKIKLEEVKAKAIEERDLKINAKKSQHQEAVDNLTSKLEQELKSSSLEISKYVDQVLDDVRKNSPEIVQLIKGKLLEQ